MNKKAFLEAISELPEAERRRLQEFLKENPTIENTTEAISLEELQEEEKSYTNYQIW